MQWLFVSIIVICTIATDVLQAHEMKRHGEISDFGARSLKRTFLGLAVKPVLILSIVCMAISFFAFIRLLQVSTLSFAVPVTAVTYVGDALFARYFLHEHLDWRRWTGILLVTVGVILISN
jgi:drug/metabolite transporter (DMT)-like permease